ncbi:hypothetical protein O6H91_01G124000 [Diphasiastrum complanatum]|uniref:Uncharacterized protein n=1 Tax=Diphasiastrum complanatum TaxID=34168 RepID=A0ACC2EVW5_DIPCM|nr:hypothetical protein O6H91_01G124000 [Diphasiastrum complanatum]
MAGVIPGREEEQYASAVQKRYDGLITVRNKAIKGKGAWYWNHLEPILVQIADTGVAKAVKLRCGLCSATFSASNPSRTASEHLKRGTCPNFTAAINRPIPSTPAPNPSSNSARKRSALIMPAFPHPISRKSPATSLPRSQALRSAPNQLILSGGKEDFGALAVLEDNVKKLKNPGMKGVTVAPALSKSQSEAALNLLADWLYESTGTISFSSVEHPKFKAFLHQVGVPPVSSKDIAGARLDCKYEEVRQESEGKLRDAMFFQLASDGWKKKPLAAGELLVNMTVNLPNGNSLFDRVVSVNATTLSSDSIQETLEGTITSLCHICRERCVGIVADTDKCAAKALQDLEFRNHWMVNVSCQAQGFNSLLKDFNKHLSLFRSVTSECLKFGIFFRNKAPAIACLHQYQRQELGSVRLIRLPSDWQSVEPQFPQLMLTLEDVLQSARPLELTITDESFKLMYADDSEARELMEVVLDGRFWTNLEAVLSLVKIVREMVHNMEVERPLISQCLPLWDDLRARVKDWCLRWAVDGSLLEDVIQRRFNKNYHPAWSAAYILDPLYLLKDNSGRYLPPYKSLTEEQEKDVDRLITRLAVREEAHIALMELLKWRSDGLDPLYAQAVQVKDRDPITGRLKTVKPQTRRLVWETCLSEFKSLSKVAVRLLFLHATSYCIKRNWSIWRWAFRNENTKLALDKAEKLIYIASQAKLGQKEILNEGETSGEPFANGDEEGFVQEMNGLSEVNKS